MFVYRYLQTTQNERLRSFSKLSNYLLSYVVFGVIFVVLVLIPLNMQFMSSDKLKESIKDVDPVAYERMKNYCVVGFSVSSFGEFDWNLNSIMWGVKFPEWSYIAR